MPDREVSHAILRLMRPARVMTSTTKSEALLVLAATIWGVNYSVVKVGTRLMSPLAFNAVRIPLAASVLLIAMFATRQRLPARRDLVALLALGAFGNGLYQVLFIEGVARTRAGTAALILAAAPAFVALIGHAGGVERLTRQRAIGITASLLGIALLVLGARGPAGSRGGGSTLLGSVLTLAACVCWSTYTVLLKPYTERLSGLTISAVTTTAGGLSLQLVSFGAIARTSWPSVTVGAWSAVVFSALFSIALAYFIWYRGIRVLGPTRTAIYNNLMPAIALVVAWVTLGETPRVVQMLGTVAIMAGIRLARA
jgi:drug/metabolite transporter (DMT)-like permease